MVGDSQSVWVYILYEPASDQSPKAKNYLESQSQFPFTREETNRFSPFLFPIPYSFGQKVTIIQDETGAVLGLAKDLICKGIEYVHAAKQDQILRNNRCFVKELVMLQGIRQLLTVDRNDDRCKPLIRAVFQSLKDNPSYRFVDDLPDEETKRDGNSSYIPTIPASMIVIRELADAATLADDRDTLIDLMNYCTNQESYPYPRDLWDRCKKLIIEGVPQN